MIYRFYWRLSWSSGAINARTLSGFLHDERMGANADGERSYGVFNLNTVTWLVVSSTAAKRAESSPEGTIAIPNAEPAAESIENSPMNFPPFVNSTISLGIWPVRSNAVYLAESEND